MKHRYFILPFIIISLMIYVIDNDNRIINKEIMISNYSINYPFFNDEKIDNYIFNYLNHLPLCDRGNITYELDNKDNIYYLTFYKRINNNNIISDDSNSFVININNSKVDRWYR